MLSKEEQQHILTEAYRHCVKQGARSVRDDGRCVYLGPNGNKCAIGAGLSGEDLERFRDADYSAHGLLEEGLQHVFGVTVEAHDDTFLIAIQSAHDDAVECNWSYLFSQVAETYGLTLPALDDE